MVSRALHPSIFTEPMLLGRAASTWWTGAERWLSLLVLHNCAATRLDATKAPEWLQARTTLHVHWRCAESAWHISKAANFPKLAVLLRTLLQVLPGRDFYLKVDADTIVVPSNLLSFLGTLSPSEPLYFGSPARRIRPCLFYQNCEQPGAFSGSIRFAQGGAEGLTLSALKRVVEADCIEHIGNLSCLSREAFLRSSNLPPCAHRAEDATLGMCMHAHGVPLLPCAGFYHWTDERHAPCTEASPSKECQRLRPETASSVIAPISVHGVKTARWHAIWWRALTK